MATTLVYGATTITLSDDLLWTDEFDWPAVAQKKTYSLSGALLVESKAKAAGRSITLEGSDDGGWMLRAVIKALETAKEIAGQQFTLTYRAVAYTVIFDHEAGAMTARPVFNVADPIDGDYYVATLRFLKV